MLEGYITPSKDTPSRSGLYASQLPGVTLSLLDDLTKDDQEDFLEFWDDIYQRAIVNFISEVQASISDKFLVDLKLLSKETSVFQDEANNSLSVAGILLEYRLPKYGKLHVVSIEVYSDIEQNAIITFYDTDSLGKILLSKNVDLLIGLNVINIDKNFSVDKLFIGYDPQVVTLRTTKNRYYEDMRYYHYDECSCTFPCYHNTQGTIKHIDGGGINAIYNAFCSIDKVVEQNINIFREAFWYRIGLELMRERILSDRFNRWTTLLAEDAKRYEDIYINECSVKLSNAIKSLRMKEDSICFNCKSLIYSSYQLP